MAENRPASLMNWVRCLTVLLLGIILLAGAGFVGLGLYFSSTRSGFQAAIAKLAEQNEPTAVRDLAPTSPQAGANAAPLLAAMDAEIGEVSRQMQGIYNTPEFKAGGLADADRKKLRQLLAQTEVLSKLREAAACPVYLPLTDYSVSPQAFLKATMARNGRLRSAVRILDWEVRAALAEGQVAEAVQTSVNALAIARLGGREPMMVSTLTSLACRGLALEAAHRALRACPPTQPERVALREELRRHDLRAQLVHALRTERAYTIDQLRPLQAQWAPIGMLGAHEVLDYYRERIETIQRDGLARATTAVQTPAAPLALTLIPAHQAAHRAALRTQAQLRSLLVLEALTADPPAGDSVDLKQLKLPPDAATDPFAPEDTLRARRTKDGWTVYSVGGNRQDDGGTFAKQADIGWAP